MSSPLPPRGRPPYVLAPPVQPSSARPRQAGTIRSRRRSPRFADRRGLTAAGGAVLLLVLGLAGGGYDLVAGTGLGLVFAICFVVGCLLTALLVHREDLAAAVVMPPLGYVAVAFVAGLVEPAGSSGSFLLGQGIAVLNAVVLDAPVLLGGTGAAALLAGARWLGSRG